MPRRGGWAGVQTLVADKALVTGILAGVAVAAYGFELFNVNLTIDEELHSVRFGAGPEWIAEGRWGMYVLNGLVLPYTVVPFVPLCLALAFNIGAVVLLVSAWGVRSRLDQAIVGAVCIAFPSMAFVYSFSTLNFGVGIGLFAIAASLVLHDRARGPWRLAAAVPAAFAVSIYQPLIVALMAVYLVHLIAAWTRGGAWSGTDVLVIVVILAGAISLSQLVQALVMGMTGIARGEYVGRLVDLPNVRRDLPRLLRGLAHWMRAIYRGSASTYGVQIDGVGLLLLLSLGAVAATLRRRGSSASRWALIGGACVALLLLPFASGLFTKGWALRWLLAAPIVIAGLVMLGLQAHARSARIAVAAVACWCVFHFVVSTNRQLAASHLALQADRLLASRVIARIDEAAGRPARLAGARYLEVVGYHERPATALVPKTETLGFSFFEMLGGDAGRIVLFLQTLGYGELAPLPLARRGGLVAAAQSMPAWPARGSVRILGDAVLVKFGEYSISQKAAICRAGDVQARPGREFCS